MLILYILGIIFPVVAVTGIGYVYGRWKRPDMAFANSAGSRSCWVQDCCCCP